MSDSFPKDSIPQSLNIEDSVLKDVQIGGIAGNDLNVTQIQDGVYVTNVFVSIGVDQSLTSRAQPLDKKEYRWRRVLLEKVKQYWIRGVLEKSLHKKILIELGLEECNDLIQRPLSNVGEFTEGAGRVFSEGIVVTDIFDQMGDGRTLLILGEPGSGKTTTLLKLVQSLVSRTEKMPDQPIPVVINLSSWAKKRLSMAEWLVESLRDIYGVSRSLGKKWIDKEELILLLDGLDEVEINYRNACVNALNQFIKDHGLTEIVVCCRFNDYEILNERLMLRSAIFVQPLTPQQIFHFLKCIGDSASLLEGVLRKNSELLEFISSPLILSIMLLTYQSQSAEELTLIGSPDHKYKQLFDQYIHRMFEHRRNTRLYSKQKTIHWLTWLARQMRNSSQTVFLIESLQPECLTPESKILSYRIVCALSIGIVGGIIGLLSGGLSGLLILGLIGMLFGLLVIGHSDEIETVETLQWSWHEAVKSYRQGVRYITLIFQIMIIMGTTFNLVNGITIFDETNFEEYIYDLIFSLAKNETNGLILLFIYAVLSSVISILFGIVCVWYMGTEWGRVITFLPNSIVGIFVGFIGGFRGPRILRSKIPNEGIWKSLKNASAFCLIIIPLVSFLVELTYWLIYRQIFVPDSTLAGILFYVFIIGGLMLGGAAILRHFILRIILYQQGKIPFNYSSFLDYAADHLFIQKVGGGYIFMHRMLLEHFASMDLGKNSD